MIYILQPYLILIESKAAYTVDLRAMSCYIPKATSRISAIVYQLRHMCIASLTCSARHVQTDLQDQMSPSWLSPSITNTLHSSPLLFTFPSPPLAPLLFSLLSLSPLAACLLPTGSARARSRRARPPHARRTALPARVNGRPRTTAHPGGAAWKGWPPMTVQPFSTPKEVLREELSCLQV